MLQGLPFLLLDFRWQRQLDLLSPKISRTASFIPQFSLHPGRSFRVAAVNSSFTPANRIFLESPVVGLFLTVWLQHSPVVISLRKRARIEKAAGAHTDTQGYPPPFMDSRPQEQSWHRHSPRDSRVTPGRGAEPG